MGLARLREDDVAPTLSNGKICYLEIPTADTSRSVHFYEAVNQEPKQSDGS